MPTLLHCTELIWILILTMMFKGEYSLQDSVPDEPASCQEYFIPDGAASIQTATLLSSKHSDSGMEPQDFKQQL